MRYCYDCLVERPTESDHQCLQAWEEPGKHMVAAVTALPETSDVTLSRPKELEE